MLLVSRNTSTNVTTPITVSTSGRRDFTASTLSRLTCVNPVISTAAPPGAATPCTRSSWVWARSVNGGAMLLTVRNRLSSTAPVAADGGPAWTRVTHVPDGEDTA